MNDKEQLILENQGLIYKAIKDLHVYWTTDDEFDDYYHAGLIGLINGAKQYDSTISKKSTFLYVCIINSIKHHMIQRNTKGRFNPYGSNISLNKLVSEEDELLDLIPDTTNLEEEMENQMEKEMLLKAVNNLPREKDQLVIKMYYGLDGYEELASYDKVAEVLGVSRSMVYTRYHRALFQLRFMLERNDRDLYFDEYWRNRKRW